MTPLENTETPQGRSETLYLASQMRGLPDEGRLNFARAQQDAEALGWSVINPHAIDDEMGPPPSHVKTRAQMSAFYMARDLEILADCSAIYLFGPYQQGTCTHIEELFALLHDIPRMYEWPAFDQRPLLPPDLCLNPQETT